MSFRELRELAIEESLWMSRTENQNQSPVVGRLRSSQTTGSERGELARRRLRQEERDPTPAPQTRDRRARNRSRRSQQEENRDRSRSPHRQLPDYPSVPEVLPPSASYYRSSGSEEAAPTAVEPQPSSPLPAVSVDAVDQSPSPSDPAVTPQHQLPQQAAQDRPLSRRRRQRRLPRRIRQIQRLPTRTATGQEEIASCIICQTNYETGEQLIVLPCEHIYHQSCITTWLLERPLCPICRLHCFQSNRQRRA